MSDIERFRLSNGKLDLTAYLKEVQNREEQEARQSAIMNGEYDWKSGQIHPKVFVRRKSKAQMKREAREAGLDTKAITCKTCLEPDPEVPRWEWPRHGMPYICGWCRSHRHICGVHGPGRNSRFWIENLHSGADNYEAALVAFWMLKREIGRISRFQKTGKEEEPIRWEKRRTEQRQAEAAENLQDLPPSILEAS